MTKKAAGPTDQSIKDGLKKLDNEKTSTRTRRGRASSKGEDLKEKNKAVATQQVIINRKLKYKYPKDCTDTLERKSFRQKVRGARNKMLAQIAGLRGKDKAALRAELEAYDLKYLT